MTTKRKRKKIEPEVSVELNASIEVDEIADTKIVSDESVELKPNVIKLAYVNLVEADTYFIRGRRFYKNRPMVITDESEILFFENDGHFDVRRMDKVAP
jgi:hypothetical protein